jgi:hypothetical protein
MIKKIVPFLFIILLIGCTGAQFETKKEAFPAMYDDRQPLSIVVVPAINNTTAVEASNYFNVTITEPLSNFGYYTMPVEIVRDIFLKEGVVDSTMIKGLPASIFRKNFGADAVLFVTINKWDTTYAVLAANVVVDLEYVMLSTDTNEIIWQYSASQVVDTTADATGFILMDILSTAVKTAVTDYVPIAQTANYQAFVALPHGQYSKLHRTDMDENVVYKKLKEAATDDQ